jgi:hypothetical protein
MTLTGRRDTRLARQLCGGIAAVALVQLLLLQPHRMLTGTTALVLCVIFGLVAFLAWLVTEARWPLIAWALVVLFVALDQNLQPPTGERDAFGEFADGATVPGPLLSAHAPTRAQRDRSNRNGD